MMARQKNKGVAESPIAEESYYTYEDDSDLSDGISDNDKMTLSRQNTEN